MKWETGLDLDVLRCVAVIVNAARKVRLGLKSAARSGEIRLCASGANKSAVFLEPVLDVRLGASVTAELEKAAEKSSIEVQ